MIVKVRKAIFFLYLTMVIKRKIKFPNKFVGWFTNFNKEMSQKVTKPLKPKKNKNNLQL